MGVIEALRLAIGNEGTMVMPTMTGSRKTEAFDPAVTPTRHMGIVAATFWRMPGVLRSTHPTSSFAAMGPAAAGITAPQPAEPVHGLDSPIGRVYERDGQVLLLGVDHTANTTIHLAEALAEVPYSIEKWCTALVDGRPVRLAFRETDHCCRNFAKAGEWLAERGLQSVGLVGSGTATRVQARDVVSVALERLAQNSTVFLCAPDQDCEECDAARRSITA